MAPGIDKHTYIFPAHVRLKVFVAKRLATVTHQGNSEPLGNLYTASLHVQAIKVSAPHEYQY